MTSAENVPLKSKTSPVPRLFFLFVHQRSAVARTIVSKHTTVGNTLEPLSFNEYVKYKNTKAMIYKNMEETIL